jgi:hypothetical protein
MSNRREEALRLSEEWGDDPWYAYRRDLLKTMLAQEDWRGFKTWSTVVATLYTEDPRWGQELGMFDPKNSTAVSQMYLLALYEEVTGKKLSDIERILEFGGGYGEMANIVHKDSEPIWYMVYDFPELGILQRWYWKEICGMKRTPATVSDLVRVEALMPDLFISLCGISEAPQPFKSQFLEVIWPSSILLQYQGSWGGNNNIEIFTEFAEDRFENIYHSQRPNHVVHQILIAWDPK